MKNDRKRETELSHELPLIFAGIIFLSSFLSFFFFSCHRFRFRSKLASDISKRCASFTDTLYLPLDDLDALCKFTRLNLLSEHSTEEHRVIEKNRS